MRSGRKACATAMVARTLVLSASAQRFGGIAATGPRGRDEGSGARISPARRSVCGTDPGKARCGRENVCANREMASCVLAGYRAGTISSTSIQEVLYHDSHPQCPVSVASRPPVPHPELPPPLPPSCIRRIRRIRAALDPTLPIAPLAILPSLPIPPRPRIARRCPRAAPSADGGGTAGIAGTRGRR